MAKVTETKVKISLVDAMSDKLNTISSGLKEFGVDLGKISGNLTKFASAGTAVVTGSAMIAAALIKSGREVSAFSNQFISYTKDVNAATEMYNLFNETYRNTNYDEQKVYDMAKGFLNVGINARKASELIMKCADTAAEMGQGVEMAEMLADCFKRLATGGQLTEKQYKALAEAGIDLSNVQDEIRKGGEAGYAALSKSLEQYAGGMQRAKGTAAEMEQDIVGNCKEILRMTSILIDDFFGFSDALKSFYQWVIDVSGKVIESIKNMRNALRENVASADAYSKALSSYGDEYDRVMEAARHGDKEAAQRLAVMQQQAHIMAQEAKDAERLKIKEEQISALEAKRTQVSSIAKNPSSGGKVKIDTSEKDYERAFTNLTKLVNDLNVKAIEATGDTYRLAMAKLKAEVSDMNDVIAKAAKEGIDTTAAVQALNEYQQTRQTKILEEKYQKEHEMRLQDLENQLSMSEMSTTAYRQKLVTELTAHKAHLETLLRDEKLSAEERMRIQSEIAKVTKEITENSTKSYKDAWRDALDEILNNTLDQYSTIRNGLVDIAEQFTNFGQNLLTESKSVTDRISDLFKNLANTIMNMFMKLMMQKALSSMLSGLGLFGAADGGYIGAKAYASGGNARGWSLVGERGPELVNFDQPGRVYNAEQTAKALGSNGNVNIRIDLRNESGQEMQAETTGSSFDGEAYVVGVVLKAISNNQSGMRSVIKGVANS